MAKFSQRQKAGQGHGRKDTGSCSVSASQLKSLLWSLILLKSFSQNVVLMLSEALVASEVCKILKSAVKQDSFFFFFFKFACAGSSLWLEGFSSYHIWAWLPCGIWGLSSLIRDQTQSPCIGKQTLKPWNTREVPNRTLLYEISPSQFLR